MPGPTFLDGETVALRTIEDKDLEFIQRERSDAAVWRTLGWPFPSNRKQLTEFFEETISDEEAIHLMITVAEEPVGMVSFHEISADSWRGELGYWVATDEQGKGYATDAVGTLVEYGFRDLGFHRIEAKVFDGNEPSRRVLEHLGFTHEGVHREAVFSDGGFRDVHWYGLLVEEWSGKE
ncbi:GNAT family protein [Halorhabdus sp. BNX81]|uniref:GNAT family N-acetyltransferase n=1 Tax=Halorhabdus sp. BNX81 TaxID=2980181 RepID=UPI0023DD6395|nr:GNAT family protein [Halorhabdus sp. BNX81]WEL22665.1 Acetyltransferase, RimL family [Halorhabdus sp. BNX81]